MRELSQWVAIMTAPRVWVGSPVEASHWCHHTNEGNGTWTHYDGEYIIFTGDVFVPGGSPKPKVGLATMKSLDTCSKVDWL